MSTEIIPASHDEAIERAADLLRGGGLVAMPTETVYGLAANAADADAVARLYEAKGRPRFNPLIAHVTDAAMAARLAHVPELARGLMQAFWPGPLTLVLPKKSTAPICDLANAGLDSVAIRAPAHPAAQALIRAVDRPLVAPSANPSGSISPTTAQHVFEGLGHKIDLILDGGACPVGVESTVVMVEDETASLLRPGGLDRGAIEPLTGPLQRVEDSATPASPGMLKSHYAPGAKVRLNASEARDDEVLLGFGQVAGDLNLSETGDLAEAATGLFAALRQLDTSGAATIAVAPIPATGLGEAINDRLQRAAAPRDS
ncbi:L-threonylcarbamoyladenylate synthase [Maricaulis sp. MIT060901]|uniref:L-threonylcarbamoyladenylate synthase n=1 Tax=Maricaulis sp. MIT060901 TaxID=3096993 RepID=UPI00399A325F